MSDAHAPLQAPAASGTLAGRIILISGAGGTLGRAAALASAAEGATVVLLDKRVPNLEHIYDEIVAGGGPVPAIYPLDLEGADEADYAELAETMACEFGVLHGLFHAAADAGILGPVNDLPARDVERIFRINCFAPLQLTRALLGLMARTGDASIVFTSDSSARRAKAYWGAYGLSKLAVEGLASILAEELEQSGKIRVNTLVPGPFRSPIHLRAYPAANRDQLRGPEPIASTLVQLLSAGAGGLHGRLVEAAAQPFLIPTDSCEAYVRT